MKKTLLLVLVLSSLIMIPGLSFAQQMHGPVGAPQQMQGGPGQAPPLPPIKFWKIQPMVEDMQLTDDQIQQLEELDSQFIEEMITLRAELEKADMKLGRLMENSNENADAAINQVEKVVKLRGELFLMEIRHRIEMDSVITKEQIEMLKAGANQAPAPQHQR